MIKKIFIFVAIINLLSSTLIAEDKYEIVVSIDNKISIYRLSLKRLI